MHDKLKSDGDPLLLGSRVNIPSDLGDLFLLDHHEEHGSITKCQFTAMSIVTSKATLSSAPPASEYQVDFQQSPQSTMTFPEDHSRSMVWTCGLWWQNISTQHYFSKYPFLFHMSFTTANAIIYDQTAIYL